MKIYVNAFLHNNLGDDLFVDILVNRYRNTKFITISNSYKNKNMKIYSNKYINRVLRNTLMKRLLIIKKSDKIISIGGSMYIEGKSRDKTEEFKGKEYYILGSNFGPYKTQEYYEKMREFFKKAQDVCFRESYSYNLFKELPNVRQAPDIIFGLDTEKIKITNRKRVIISVISCKDKIGKYEEEYEEKIIEIMKFFKEKGYEICLMSFCKEEGDEKAIELILTKAKMDNILTYYYKGNREEALNILADSQIIVGSRFHANILGLVLNKTIIPISYSKKTNNVLNDIGYKGMIINISEIKKFQTDLLTEDILNYKLNIDDLRKRAQEQFKALDVVLT